MKDYTNASSTPYRFTTVTPQGTTVTEGVARNATVESLSHKSRYGKVPKGRPPSNFEFSKVRTSQGSRSYSYSRYWFNPNPPYNQQDYRQYFGVGVETGGNTAPSLPILSSIVYNDMLEKLADKVTSSTNLVVSLAESKQTAQMIGAVNNKLKKLIVLFTNAYTDIKRGRFKKLLTTLQKAERKRLHRQYSRAERRRLRRARGKLPFRPTVTVSDFYLEYKLGWLPLISDIHAIISNDFARQPRARLRAFSSKSDSSFSEYNRSVNTVNSTEKVRCKRSVSRVAIGGLDVVFDVPQLAQDRLFNTNPASVVWELLPGSFLIDYVANFGQYIRLKAAAVPLKGVRYMNVYTGQSSLTESSVNSSGITPNPSVKHVYGSSSGGSYSRQAAYKRTVGSGLFPFPAPEWPALDLSKLGVSRTATLLAVLRKTLLRRI